MIRRTFFILSCAISCVMAMPFPGNSAILNGYTFSDDSTELWQNPYFSGYERLVDISSILYGYGDFADTEYSLSYHQTDIVGDIACAVFNEGGYYPTFSGGSGAFTMEYYSGLVYYAKDTADNIHVLQTVTYLPAGTVSWNYSDLAEGETTLKYPGNPSAGQVVFRGTVTCTEAVFIDYQSCMSVLFDSLPQFPSHSITEFLRPGTGLIAITYNWEGRINGFSYNGLSPDEEDEDKHGWEKWTDEHCFIMACRPSRGMKQSINPGSIYEFVRRLFPF